jgi:hypothetical protein
MEGEGRGRSCTRAQTLFSETVFANGGRARGASLAEERELAQAPEAYLPPQAFRPTVTIHDRPARRERRPRGGCLRLGCGGGMGDVVDPADEELVLIRDHTSRRAIYTARI